jgi:hypothetical protein
MTRSGHPGLSTVADQTATLLLGSAQEKNVRRREFITLAGGAIVGWPLVAYTQQIASPVIGFLDPRTPEVVAARLRGFRQGLKESGFVEGENVAIVYGWAEDQIDRLPSLAVDLVRRPLPQGLQLRLRRRPQPRQSQSSS